MLTVNVISNPGTEKVINGQLCGEKFNVPFSENLIKELKAKQAEYDTFTSGDQVTAWQEGVAKLLVDSNLANDIIETACPDLKKDRITGFYYIVVDGETSKSAVPEGLVEVILESIEKEIDPTPLVKAWIRFLRNPNFSPSKAERFVAYITAEIVDFDEAERLEEEEGFSEEIARERATYNDVAVTHEG